jgi:hypothetical protein
MLDLRLPQTRAQDKIGDIVVLSLAQVLDMDMLLAHRRLAIAPSSSGVRTGYAPFPSSPSPSPEQGHDTIVYDTDELTIEFTMTRDTRIDGVNWKISFRISGRAIMSRRQQTRIENKMAEFARNRRLYLSDPELTTNVTYLQFDVRAKIGNITEPE